MRKIYDNRQQAYSIRNWKKYGLLCREGETYKDIYNHVMSIDKSSYVILNSVKKLNIRDVWTTIIIQDILGRFFVEVVMLII